MIRLESVVGSDDPAHQLVPHHIVIGQVAKGDVVDLVEDTPYDPKTAAGAARQVDLGDVAGDHNLGAGSSMSCKAS